MARFRADGTLTILLALFLTAAGAQETVMPSEVHVRSGPLLTPAREGRNVVLKGVVSSVPVHLFEYSLLSVQSEDGSGVCLEMSREQVGSFQPGDRVEAAGVVTHRAGLPVIRVTHAIKVGSAEVPKSQTFTVGQLNQIANLGRNITVEGNVVFSGNNAGGDLMTIAQSGHQLTVFLPLRRRDGSEGLSIYEPGDRVLVTGISSQYCPVPPYNRNFQILITSGAAVRLLAKHWIVPPTALFAVTGVVVIGGALWWWREQKMRIQRRVFRGMMALSENLLGASSSAEIARRVESELPHVTGATGAEVFVLNSTHERLERIPTDKHRQPLSISVNEPIGTFLGAAALALRNGALLRIPDTRRSPLLSSEMVDVPRSAIFIPMFSQGELTGVLAVHQDRRNLESRPGYDSALQHLSNQIAASLRLQEQQHIREQLLRSDKLAAAGQLISGIANDLKVPLTRIGRTARRITAINGDNSLMDIAAEADRGLEAIEHMLSFARMEGWERKPLDLYGLLNDVLEAREPEMTRRGLTLQNEVPLVRVEVLGDRSQLDHLLIMLLVAGEHAAAEAPDRTLKVSGRVLGRRVAISFGCSSRIAAETIEEALSGDSRSFPVAQMIVQGHGGELRYLPRTPSGFRLEVEFSFQAPEAAPAAAPGESVGAKERPSRTLTALILEPDAAVQRTLLTALSSRGHRAIPASRAEDAADMARRMQFDLLFCAARMPGSDWVQLFDRLRRRVSTFVLLTEGIDVQAETQLRSSEAFTMAKPVEENELDRLLEIAESRVAIARH